MKKGFTLIELLAVIVILAIIAVIAVPIVIGIIDNSKESTAKISIDNYVKATKLFLMQTELTDGYYNIETLDIDVDRTKPAYGYIEVKDNELINYNISMDNKNYIIKNGKEQLTKDDPMKAVSELSIDYVNQEIIKGISLSYGDILNLKFYIDKNKVKDKKVYLRAKSALINTVNDYIETTKYIIFSYNDFTFQEFTNNTLFEIVEEDGTENGTVIDSINYDIRRYANNKIYKTENEFEKEVLISLMNLGAAVQNQFNYKTDDLAYNILKEEDRNINSLTEKGLEFYNNISLFNIDIENNTNQVFTDIGITVNNPSLSLSNVFSANIRFRKTTNFTEEEFSKYGYILFDEEDYNKLKRKGKEAFNVNSEEIFDIVNNKNNKALSIISNQTAYFSYKLSIKYLSDILCAMPYYIDENGVYKYGSLIKFSPIFIAKDYIDKSTTSDKLKNVSYSIINFAALIN